MRKRILQGGIYGNADYVNDKKGEVMKKIILAGMMCVLMAGCGRNGVIVHSYQTNYTIGQPMVAYVGSPILQVNDHYTIQSGNIDRTTKGCMTANTDFSYTGGFTRLPFSRGELLMRGKRGDSYNINGMAEISGKKYIMISVHDKNSNEWILYVDDTGKISNNYASQDPNSEPMTSHSAILEPATLQLTKNAQDSSCRDNSWPEDDLRGLVNYELLFGGVNNVTMSATYREYTSGDVARSAFFQNLVFETSAKQIRFKNTKINVIKVDNEKIEYIVESDGLESGVVSSDDMGYSQSRYSQMVGGR